mmetsp:Transcript_48030/g.159185  ORF Transcript_48030/g.159185 Transcript_48030/m.159185 type:complete len:240 (-) Transcript_48030:2424-3143(-)
MPRRRVGSSIGSGSSGGAWPARPVRRARPLVRRRPSGLVRAPRRRRSVSTSMASGRGRGGSRQPPRRRARRSTTRRRRSVLRWWGRRRAAGPPACHVAPSRGRSGSTARRAGGRLRMRASPKRSRRSGRERRHLRHASRSAPACSPPANARLAPCPRRAAATVGPRASMPTVGGGRSTSRCTRTRLIGSAGSRSTKSAALVRHASSLAAHARLRAECPNRQCRRRSSGSLVRKRRAKRR